MFDREQICPAPNFEDIYVLTIGRMRHSVTLWLNTIILLWGKDICGLHGYTLTPAVAEVIETQSATLVFQFSERKSYVSVWDQPQGPNALVSYGSACNIYGILQNNSLYSVSCNKTTVTVKIINVSRSQHGDIWKCSFEENPEQLLSSRIHVKVPVSGVSLNTTGTIILRENISSYISCNTLGARPAPTITWWIRESNGFALQLFAEQNVTEYEYDFENLTKVSNTISIKLNRTLNRFVVHCTAHNIVEVSEVTSSEVIINVTYPPNDPMLNVNVSTVEVFENKPLELVCYVVGGNPPPEVNLTCSKSILTTHLSMATNMSTVSAMLGITATKGETNTSCDCVSTFLYGKSSVEVLVSVLYPPTAPIFEINGTKYVTEANIVQARTVNIDCQTDSNPSSKFSWMKSGYGEILSNRSTLILNNVTIRMRGDYICHVNNTMITSLGATELGSNYSSFSLDVLYPPRIRDNLTSTTAIEGQSVDIECLIDDGNKAQYNVSWIHERDGRVWNSSLLHLPSARRNDSSNYTCHVRYTMEQTIGSSEEGHDSKTVQIDVTYMPEITNFYIDSYVNKSTLELNESDSATFKCFVESNPGSNVTLSSSAKVIHTTRSNYLTYMHGIITCWDSDTYICTANNGIDSGNRRENIRKLLLQINCSPRPFNGSKEAMPLQNISSKLGESATLSLQVIGYPKPNGQWYKTEKENTREIKNGHKTKMTNESKVSRHEFVLEITDISQDDVGQYQLHLANRFGMFTQNFSIFADENKVSDDGLNSEDVPWMAIGGGVGSSLLIIFAVVVITIYLSRKRNQEQKHHSIHDKNDIGKDVSLYANVAKDGEELLVREFPETSLTEQKSYLQEIDDKPDHIKEYGEYEMVKRQERVNVSDLYTHLRERNMDFFGAEFMNIPNGLTMSYEVSQRPDNRPLNRYNGIYPYDHSRVTVPGNREFFINACYIEGLKRKKTYIASLGPTSVTTMGFTTFWQMVWSEKSDVIVMLTKLAEPSGIKCDRYWPEVGATIAYGQIIVTSEEEKEFAEYTSTRLSVALDRERRTVYHYFFTAWPDKRVPENVTCLIDFRRRVRLQHSKGPLIVHCSAGIGRTGTLIALDILIEQGESKGYVNVFQCVKNMRDQRTNMVQTAEQYFFIYKALVNVLIFGCEYMSAIQISEVNKKRSDENMLNKMFQQLKKTVESDSLEEGNARSFNRHQKKKNRLGADIPGDAHRVHLSPNGDMVSSDYINAVYVNSFTSTNHFIVAQTPLEDDVDDFLTMIFEKDVSCIVSLDDGTNRHDIGEYNMNNQTVDYFHVTSRLLDTKENYIVSKITIDMPGKNNTGRKSVYHFQYTDWPARQKVPEPRKFAEFVNDVEEYAHQLGSKNASVLVHCLTASERSCLFVAVVCMAETMKHEGEVCVSNVLRKIKSRRPTAFPNFEQFQFCFEALSAFLTMEHAGKSVEDAAYVNMAVG